MTNKMKFFTVLLIFTAALLFTSCGDGSSDRLTSAEVTAIEDYVMSSYFILRGDSSLPESRTAWDYTEEVLLPTSATPTSKESVNYPEKGQRTTVSIEQTGVADVYKVTNTTTYPKREDSILNTVESYYIKDNGDGYLNKLQLDGTNLADPICEADGTLNDNFRIKYETTFKDGNVRKEIVKATMIKDSINYAEFPIDGALTFPAPAADGSWAPPEGDGTTGWSSMVIYEQIEGNAYSLWDSYKNIMGVRYYTEQGSGSSLVRTSVSYERMIARDAESLSSMDNLTAFIERLFSDNPDSNDVYTGETLTETVVRTKIVGNKWKQVKSDSKVFDQSGQTVVTFSANYAEDENGVVTSSGAPVAVY